MSWNAKYALIIGSSTFVTYLSGLLIGYFAQDKGNYKQLKQKIVIGICIGLNIAVLAVFKYGNFAIDTLNHILSILNISTSSRRLDLLLPVGISFYTFQALGYIIDVYRGDVNVEKNIVRYALFVSFFPQLVAGPIERSKNLITQIKQIEKINLWNAKRVTSGLILMIWGFFMKMVIADRVAILVDKVFENYRTYGGTELIIATIGFALQIYCDFGSYSMIAIGTAKIMGIELMENFNAPYMARSVHDFWNRWHISLSSWFKDYLYIPLGGNRKGNVRKYLNVMIVFLVSGLWHGANWSFVIWGALHGAYQVFGDITKKLREFVTDRVKIKTECFSWKALQTVITFCLVDFAWIFFRADTISDALCIIKRIIVKPTPWLLFNGVIYNLGLGQTEMDISLISVLLLVIVDFWHDRKRQTLDILLMEQNVWFEWMVIIGLVIAIFVFGEYGPTFDAKQFLYFQF